MRKITLKLFVILFTILYIVLSSALTLGVAVVFEKIIMSNELFAVVLAYAVSFISSLITILVIKKYYLITSNPLKITLLLGLVWTTFSLAGFFYSRPDDNIFNFLKDVSFTIFLNMIFVYLLLSKLNNR